MRKAFLMVLFVGLFGGSALAAQQSVTNTLTWTDNSNNETMFKIERSINKGAFVPVASVLANITTYSETFPADIGNTEYCYRVEAGNSAGDSVFSNVACKTSPVIVLIVIPNAPSGANIGQQVGPVVP